MGYKAGVNMNWSRSCDLGRRFNLDMFDDTDSTVIEAARLNLAGVGDGHKLLWRFSRDLVMLRPTIRLAWIDRRLVSPRSLRKTNLVPECASRCRVGRCPRL